MDRKAILFGVLSGPQHQFRQETASLLEARFCAMCAAHVYKRTLGCSPVACKISWVNRQQSGGGPLLDDAGSEAQKLRMEGPLVVAVDSLASSNPAGATPQVLGVNFAGATRGVGLKLGIALGPASS